jgi:hypothetical protein
MRSTGKRDASASDLEELLERYIRESGIYKKELAKRLDLHRNTLRALIKGPSKLDKHTANRIADELALAPADRKQLLIMAHLVPPPLQDNSAPPQAPAIESTITVPAVTPRPDVTRLSSTADAVKTTRVLKGCGLAELTESLWSKSDLPAVLYPEATWRRFAWPTWRDFESGTVVEVRTVDEVIDQFKQDRVLLLYGALGSGKSVIAKNVGYKLMHDEQPAWNVWIAEPTLHFGLATAYDSFDADRVLETLRGIDDERLLVILDDAHLDLDKVDDFRLGFENELVEAWS